MQHLSTSIHRVGNVDHDPNIQGMAEEEAAEYIDLMHRGAKRMWRRFTGRPVRKFRGYKRHLKGKGKGKSGGKGRGQPFMWT